MEWNGMELSMRAPNRVTISIIITIIAFNILEMELGCRVVTVQSWRARFLKFLKIPQPPESHLPVRLHEN